MNMDLVKNILSLPDHDLNILFKPKQQEVLQRFINGKTLDKNQKRYLRGDIRVKIDTLSSLLGVEKEDELRSFLNGVENYYITGYSALKHNGFGWYFDVKRIRVKNTRLDGSFHISQGIVKLTRTRSIKNRSFSMDQRSGLKYATNDQILKDAMEDDDEALIMECMSHLKRYGELFIKDHKRYLKDEKGTESKPEDFGV